ncbi:thermopsin [Acidianus hospitalis W1]|uniref:Thermopsin n=1 Tax=Acidianus hospitalis (strain W1) TaxID=933801 RepID=F4B4E8_ACIHW|nr:thermopsin [Acidianus hospitalis]AEE93037.1 thermopsin [Acidianus hospitalis W1]
MEVKLVKAFLIILLLLSPFNYFSNFGHSLTTNRFTHVYPPRIDPKLSHVQGGVNVYSLYNSEPAPMGIADYGIGPNGPYIRNTSQVLAKAHICSLNVDSSINTDCVSAQLNVVLSYCYNGNQYSIWLQDVALIMLFNNTIKFIDNIWNLSSVNANVIGVKGKGTLCTYHGVTFYYYCANGYPGSPCVFSYPLNFCMLINVSENSLGEPVAYFWYNDGHGWVNYDTVTFLFPHSRNVNITINGYQYTGSGDFYDIEFDIVGPGGGTCAYFNNACVYLYLYYWNGHNFQEIKNAYNFGSDTGETSNNVIASGYYIPSSGELTSGLKAGQGSLAQIWSSNQVSVVKVRTSIRSGYVSFSQSKWNSTLPMYKFCGYCAIITLYPGNYNVIILNNQGKISGESYVKLLGGKEIQTYCYHFKLISPQSICIFYGENNVEYIEICGMGYANLSLKLPNSISYVDNFTPFINGKEVVELILIPHVLYCSAEGILTVTLSSGLTCTSTFKIVATTRIIEVCIKVESIGNTLPEEPKIKVQFPNGSIEEITQGKYLLPAGSTYCLPKCIYENNQIRWILNSSNEGKFTLQGEYTFYYYEEYLVNFSFKVIGSSYNFTPEVYYYSAGKLNESLAGLIWADYNSTYYYQQCVNYGKVRYISFNYTGEISSFKAIAIYYQQYYVNVNSMAPLYAEINGVNQSFSSGWFNYSTRIIIENITFYPCAYERYIISSVTPSIAFTVDSPVNVKVSYIIQYYVEVNAKIPVYAFVNGSNVSFSSGWYNKGDHIKVENVTWYKCPFTRFIITSINPSNFTVGDHIIVNVSCLEQFYVHVYAKIPLYAEVNGINGSFTSGWYNDGICIYVENVTFYPCAYERYIISSIKPSSIRLCKPLNVTISCFIQFFICVKSKIPVYAFVNGSNVSFSSGWYNKGDHIKVENVPFYISPKERCVISSPLPSFTVENHTVVTLKTIIQFLVCVISVIPIKAYVNGEETTIGTSWINEGTKIEVINYTYYPCKDERYVITSINPSSTIFVNSSVKLAIYSIKQFLVCINGIKSWYNAGSKIVLNATIPIYEVGEFIGTYNVSPGSVIVVNSPVVERLVENLNYVFIILVAVIVLAISIIIFIKIRK